VIFFDRFVSHEEMAEFIGRATSTSLRIVTKRKWFRERWPMRWCGKAIISTPYCTRLKYWTTAGPLCPSKILKRSQIRPSNCGYSCHPPCMRKRAYTLPETCLETSRAGYMETSSEFAATAWNTARSVFGARYSQSARSVARVETGSCQRADRRHRNAATCDFHHPQSR